MNKQLRRTRSTFFHLPVPLLFELLEPRCLYSVSVQPVVSHYVADNGPGGVLAHITAFTLPEGLAGMRVVVTWDNNPQETVAGEVGGTDAGMDVYASYPLYSLGTHTAHVQVFEDFSGGVPSLEVATFNTTGFVSANSEDGTTIHAAPGQTFSGFIGWLPDVNYVGYDPANTNSEVVGLTTVDVDWGDGTGGNLHFVPDRRGGIDVYGEHTYAASGVYRIYMQVEGRESGNPYYTGPRGMLVLPDFIVISDQVFSTAVVGDPQQLHSLQMTPPPPTAQSSQSLIEQVGNDDDLSNLKKKPKHASAATLALVKLSGNQ